MSIEAITLARRVEGLIPRDRFVLFVLADYANDDLEAWPRQATIASDTGYNRTTVNRALKSLEDEGLLTSLQEQRGDGGNSTKRYRLNLHNLHPPKSDSPGVASVNSPLLQRSTPPVAAVNRGLLHSSTASNKEELPRRNYQKNLPPPTPPTHTLEELEPKDGFFGSDEERLRDARGEKPEATIRRLAPELHEDLLRLYKLQNLNQNKQRHEWADMLGVLDEFGAGLIRRVLGGTKALGAALDNPLAHFRKHLAQAVKTEVAAKREQRKAQEAREADEAAVRERQERGPLKVEDMDLTPRGRKFLEDLEKRRKGAGVEAESTPTSRGLR